MTSADFIGGAMQIMSMLSGMHGSDTPVITIREGTPLLSSDENESDGDHGDVEHSHATEQSNSTARSGRVSKKRGLEKYNERSGYPTTVFKQHELATEFTCGICHEVAHRPADIKCGHIYCYSCITQHLRKKNDCPQCARKLIKSEVRVSNVLKLKVEQMEVKCEHHEAGCQWTGVMGADGMRLYEHYTNDCEHAHKTCECGEEVMVGDLDFHSEKCVEMKTSCKYCGDDTIQRKQLADHQRSWHVDGAALWCQGLQPCPQGCKDHAAHLELNVGKRTIVRASSLSMHQADECPHTPVRCEVCDEMVKRYAMWTHFEDKGHSVKQLSGCTQSFAAEMIGRRFRCGFIHNVMKFHKVHERFEPDSA